jgi:uncharacterized protein YukE
MLLPAGGGGTPEVSGDSFTVKTTGVAPINASGMSASEIEGLFANLMPGAVAEAGAAHTEVSQVLAHIADAVVTHVTRLQQNWEGSAASSAVSAFQQLHSSATTLATAAAQTGAVLSWLGSDVLPEYAGWTAPSNGIVGDVESLFGDNPQNSAAQQKMNELNQQLVAANAKLPASVKISLPKSSAGLASAGSSAAGGPGAGSGSSVTALSGVGSGAGSASGLSSGGGAPAGSGTISTTHGSGGSPTLSTGGSTPGSGTSVSGIGPTGTGTGTTGGFGTGSGTPASGSTPTVGGGGGGSSSLLPGSGGFPGSTNPGTTDDPGTTDSSLPGVPGDEGLPGSGSLPGEPGILPGTIGDGVGPGDGLGGGDVPGNLMPINGFPGTGGTPGENGFGSSGSFNSGLGDDLGEGLLPGDNTFMGPDGMIGMIPGDPAAGGMVGPNGSFVDDSPYGVGGVPGEGAAAGGADAAAADGAGGMPMMGMGTGNNRDEAGRNRDAWMNEDAELWNGGAQAVPSLITR